MPIELNINSSILVQVLKAYTPIKEPKCRFLNLKMQVILKAYMPTKVPKCRFPNLKMQVILKAYTPIKVPKCRFPNLNILGISAKFQIFPKN